MLWSSGPGMPRRLPVGAAQRHRPLHGAPVLFALRSPVLVEHAAPGRQQPAALWSQHPVGSVDPDPYRLSGRRSHLCPLPPLYLLRRTGPNREAVVGPVPAGRPAVGWNPDVGAWGRPLPAGGVGSGPAVLAGLGAASQPLATLGGFHPPPTSLADRKSTRLNSSHV